MQAMQPGSAPTAALGYHDRSRSYIAGTRRTGRGGLSGLLVLDDLYEYSSRLTVTDRCESKPVARARRSISDRHLRRSPRLL